MGIFSKLFGGSQDENNGMETVEIDMEAANLMQEFSSTPGDDLESRNTRFCAALKLHYKHGIGTDEEGFYFMQEGE